MSSIFFSDFDILGSGRIGGYGGGCDNGSGIGSGYGYGCGLDDYLNAVHLKKYNSSYGYRYDYGGGGGSGGRGYE